MKLKEAKKPVPGSGRRIKYARIFWHRSNYGRARTTHTPSARETAPRRRRTNPTATARPKIPPRKPLKCAVPILNTYTMKLPRARRRQRAAKFNYACRISPRARALRFDVHRVAPPSSTRPELGGTSCNDRKMCSAGTFDACVVCGVGVFLHICRHLYIHTHCYTAHHTRHASSSSRVESEQRRADTQSCPDQSPVVPVPRTGETTSRGRKPTNVSYAFLCVSPCGWATKGV